MVQKTYLLGSFCVLVSAVLFGIQPIFGAQLQSFDVDPLALNTIRYGVPAAFLLLISGRVGTTLNLSYVLRHGWLGLGFAGAGLGYYKAGYSIGFGLAVILFFSFPLFVSLYSASILRIKTSAIQIVTMLTSLLELVIAMDIGHLEINSLSGAGWAFFSAICYAGALLYRAHGAPHVGEYLSLTALMVTASLVLLPIAWITDAQFPVDTLSWSWAIGLAIVSGLIPIGLVMAGSRLIGAVDTATLCVIEPIVAILVSILILNEVSSSSTLYGGFLVIGSAVLLVRTQQKNNRVPQQVT
jgi:drug/metabolite transporter (DMT)-like permease